MAHSWLKLSALCALSLCACASQASAADYTCDVEADRFLEVDRASIDAPSVSGTLRAVELRPNIYAPLADIVILSADEKSYAGLRVKARRGVSELGIFALVGPNDDTATEHLIGEVAPNEMLIFSLFLTEDRTFHVEAGDARYEAEFPNPEVGDTIISCSSGVFEFTDVRFGARSVESD